MLYKETGTQASSFTDKICPCNCAYDTAQLYFVVHFGSIQNNKKDKLLASKVHDGGTLNDQVGMLRLDHHV